MRRPGTLTVALTIAGLTVTEMVRGRLPWLVAGFIVAGCALALFAGGIAITESQGFRAGILGAWLRSWAVFTISLSVVASMVRERHDKAVEVLLSLPVPRGAYCTGKLVGFAGMAALWSLACALALAWFAPPAQAAIWSASLALELFLVASMSLMCAISFTQITWAVSAAIATYLLSRAIAAIQLMAHESAGAPETASRQFFRAFVDTLAFLLPDLDRFTESEWLIHGTGTAGDLGLATVQTAVYASLLGAVALFDLYRKAL